MGIYIIAGIPGSGKTSFNTALACINILDRQRYLNCCAGIDNLNSLGYNFAYPKKEHCVFSSYRINLKNKYCSGKESYAFNPFKFALPNEDIEYMQFPPYSSFHIMEGQIYYNSRKSKGFRACISRLFENHRHNHYDIYIDAQRAGLIDLNIREIATVVYFMLGVEHDYDDRGNIVKSTWQYYLFDCIADYDSYIATKKTNNEIETATFEGNIFNCYNSYENQRAFYSTDKTRQLDYVNWEDVKEKFMKVPENYYEK